MNVTALKLAVKHFLSSIFIALVFAFIFGLHGMIYAFPRIASCASLMWNMMIVTPELLRFNSNHEMLRHFIDSRESLRDLDSRRRARFMFGNIYKVCCKQNKEIKTYNIKHNLKI